MSIIDTVHGGYVHTRRADVLARHLADLLPHDARVLDIGCGDGLLARRVLHLRPDLRIEGIDVLVRPSTHIPVTRFDGRHIPHESGQFDAAVLVDVVHHIEDPMPLLREALRVSRKCLVIKDHTRDGWLAGPTLRAMDYIGNARHGVALPHNYWPRAQWNAAIDELQLRVGIWRQRLGLYPVPADWLFGRSLHFLARLDIPCTP
jgi:SAM-dependent methyltransferase